MFNFEEDILSSLNDSEIETLLYSIKDGYTSYDDFKGGAKVKFELVYNLYYSKLIKIYTYARIDSDYKWKWIWTNSIRTEFLEKFSSAYNSILRERKINLLIQDL